MMDHIWDFFVDTLIAMFMPMVCTYFAFCGDLFLNVSATDATGLEKAGNTLLVPFQYLFAGRDAVQQEDGSWRFVQKYDYNQALWVKSAASVITLPASLVVGSTVKALSYLNQETRERHASMKAERLSIELRNSREELKKIGLDAGDPALAGYLEPEWHARRPGDENYMLEAKECLREIAKVLNEAVISWWIDCGTLLGAYRYGGIIPWDNDIDISILLPDFHNARKAFNRLDKTKYIVQDWSGRDFPDTYFKIYIRKTGHWIDVDFYAIDQKNQQLSCIYSMENNVFCMEWWTIGELRFKKPISYNTLFPLKKSTFDGIEVFVPNDSVRFLQRYYGENLAPAKIYNPNTKRFEKDMTHPYWQEAYVH